MADETHRDAGILATFLKAEQTGLKLAIKGRLVALALMALWIVLSRGAERAADLIPVIGIFVVLGICHFKVIGTQWDRPWTKYLFLTIDVLLLSALVAAAPVSEILDLPQTFKFRFDVFPYYFLLVAIASFSFSPGMVLWAGLVGSAGWMAAYYYIFRQIENPLGWSDAQASADREGYISIFLSPNFIPFGSRLQEIIVLMITAILLAVVMKRARQTVYAHLEADDKRRNVSDMFGRHVPKAIADMMISDRGALEPVECEATVLFVDIAGFTGLTEKLGPARITEVLNAYFDAATEIISSFDGVITQFQGDAILAIFNLPVADPDHAEKALVAAETLLKRIKSETYGGETLGIRIGINTGNLIAGNVGGGGRQTYTVHGDAVNTAARLEAMNKELGTSILVSEATASRLQDRKLKSVGQVEIRGLSAQTAVFTLEFP